MMQHRHIHTTKKFDKDITLAVRRGKDTSKLRTVIDFSSLGNFYRRN